MKTAFSNAVFFSHRQSGIAANDGKWHQICFSWKNSDGKYKVYKDGVVVKTGTGFKKGYLIKGGGSLVLGQEQDKLGGSFDSSQSFKGSLTNLNVWSYVLPEGEIKEMSNCCRAGPEGNVYMWENFLYAIIGKPRRVIPARCKCTLPEV